LVFRERVWRVERIEEERGGVFDFRRLHRWLE
jgi:hypothetical protein